MKLKLFLIFILTLSIGFSINDAYAAAVDTWTFATTTNVGWTKMWGVSMGDANNGVAVGELGQIVYTTNGGVDWTDATTTNVSTTTMRGVSMSDASNGVAVGSGGTIVYTTNGGVDWTAATTTNAGILHMVGVSMSDASNGVAVGSGGTIVYTTNGGVDWTAATTTNAGILHMIGVSMSDASNGVAVGYLGTIVYTTNGGVDWTAATTTNVGTENMYDVSMSDANNGVAVGALGQIVYTTNGGVDWTDATTPNVRGLVMWGVSMSDANNGVAVGEYGRVVYTTNGGVDWTDINFNAYVSTAPMYGVSMGDASNGVAVGNLGTMVYTIGITEVATLEHDTTVAIHNSLVQVDSDTYALAYAGPNADGYISTFTISSDGSTITEVATLEHDTLVGWYNSMVQVDSDTYALAYAGDGNDGYISTFTISADGSTITEVATLEHDTTVAIHNSLVQVDSDTYALAYAGDGNDGYISTFTISADGSTITEVATLEHDTEYGADNSLVQVDSDTYALAYTGDGNDGYISTFTISADGSTITEVATLEHDTIAGYYNSLVQVDSNTYALAYTGPNTDGYISTFTIPSDGSTITEVATLEHNTLYGTNNSMVQVDSDTYALAYAGGSSSDGYISTFTIPSDGSTITELATLEHDTTAAIHNSLVQVDSDTYALAYTGYDNDGYISTFTISSADSVAPTITGVDTTETDGSFGEGETIDITVTFDEAVTVTGTPQLTLETGGSDAVVNYSSGSGGTVLTFVYTVADGHASSDLDYVATSSLALNSGTIKDAQNNAAVLTLASPAASNSLGANAALVVETTAPTFTVTSVSPTSGNTAKVGDNVVVTLTAGSNETGLTASGTQTINGVTSSFNESGGGVYTITYTVVEGNTDRADSGALPVSITLQDSAGNAGTEITTIASGTAPGVDANSPAFSSAATTSTTQIAITVNQSVSDNSLSAGDFTLGGVSGGSIGSIVSVSGTTITLGVTGATIADTDTVTIAYTQSSGSVDDANGNSLQNFSAQSVTNHLDTTAPTISFTSVTPTSGTQVVGETVVIRVTAGSSETGLTLSTSTINGVTPTFNEVGSGVYDLTYTIVEGNTDIIDASAGVPYSIILNDANGNPSNTLAATIGTNSSPGVDANSPSISFTSVTPTSGTQVVGETVVIRVTAGSSETGLTLSTSTINGVTPTFNEVGSGVYDLTYTIVEGNTDIIDASAGVPYSIILNDANGNPSNTLAATIATNSSPGVGANPPSKVGTVTPTTGSTLVTLSWDAPSVNGSTPITDYIIQYSTDNSTWSTFADGTSTDTTATVTGLTNNTVYYFKVAAVNGGGTGSYSNSVSANAGAPSQVIISATVESGSTTSLSWSAPANGGSAITDYIIQYSTDNSTWSTFSDGTSTDTSVTVTGLSNCNDYFYRISAVNGIGTGTASSNSQNTLDVVAGYDYEGRGVQDFTTKQQFGSSIKFESAQTFGAVQEFGATQIFGKGNTFANSQNFCGTHNFVADEIEFGTATTFDTAQTFGDAAKFAANQDFTNVDHDFTSTSVFFDAGAIFSANEVMGVGADFSSGTQNFGNAMTFDEATEFGDLQDWSTQTHTFEKYMHFGDTNDFAEKIQTFKEGTSFGEGTIFKDNQSIPINTIPSFGMLLQAITCGSDTSSETCMPNDATKYLSPGEFLTAGQDPAPTSISISKNNKDFSVDGIGLEMTFTDITTNGTIESDLYDPANIPSSTLVGSTGKVSVSTSNVGTVETIGSVMNISTGTSSVSGAITVSLKYSEDNIPAGTAESNLTMLHYTGGAWKTEDSCTVDTVNNKVTCTVTSLSPFGIGGPGSGASSSASSSSSSGGGGNNCDSKGFGVGRSLMVYQVDFSEDTNIVTLQAYSTCGTISAKITTESGSQVMGLSMEQPLIDENIVMYSATLPEGIDNFTINLHNNKNTFDEKYYSHGNDITKSYTGETGYASEQQGMALPTITSEQTTILPETTIVSEPAVKITPEIIDELKDAPTEKLIIDEKSSTPVEQTTAYTPEPTSSTCGLGTFEKNGICVMDNDLIKTPQESVSGGLETNFVLLVIVLGAVAILAIIILAKRKKKSD